MSLFLSDLMLNYMLGVKWHNREISAVYTGGFEPKYLNVDIFF